MLENIGPSEEPPFLGIDSADFLDGRLLILIAESFHRPAMLVSRIIYFLRIPSVRLLMKSEVAGADIPAVIVVQYSCTIMLDLHSFY